MLGVNKCNFIQTHQVIGNANPTKSSLGGSKIFTTKSVKAITFFQLTDLGFSFVYLMSKFASNGCLMK